MIKTRNVEKGTIKTLDRASSMTHRIKTASIRAKENTIQERKSDENSSSFAIGKTMKAGEMSVAATGTVTEAAVRREYREYGKKKLKGEKERQRSSRIRGNGSHLSEKKHAYSHKNESNSLKSPKSAKTRQRSYIATQRNKRFQQYGQRKLIGEKRRIVTKGVKATMKAIKAAAIGAKALMSALIAAGSSAVLVIVICIFLSASIYLFGQDTNDEYSAEALGVGDTLIMRVASAQLGNVGGLKFCKWYGFSRRVEWCACFVSWCANQCGYIDKGIIPKFALVGDGVDWFKARKRFQNNKYIPHPGDIIFFDWESDGTRDHVGFVERYDGKVVYTIEGNSGDACKRLAYRVGHPEILGYGVPAYPLPQSASKPTKPKTEGEKKTTAR